MHVQLSIYVHVSDISLHASGHLDLFLYVGEYAKLFLVTYQKVVQTILSAKTSVAP